MAGLSAPPSLAERLRGLRQHFPGASITQKQVADALGLSVPLVSSWESGKAVPPEDRLRAYALLFATEHAFADGQDPPSDEADLTDAEELQRRRLIDELIDLRDQALRRAGAPSRQTGALGGRFWYYPDGAPIRIITSPLWPSERAKLQYANKWHPNYIESFTDADRDATIELYGHIRAENPTADVRFLTADRATNDDLLGNVVVLGQGDGLLRPEEDRSDDQASSVLDFLSPRLELPLGQRLSEGGEFEFDSVFVVTTDLDGTPTWFPPGAKPTRQELYRPRFLRESDQPGKPRQRVDGLPVLEYDVALLARRRNPLNLAATITICCGAFSRGTLGAVRALTDPVLRTRNESFLAEHFARLDDFWLLLHVPVFRGADGLSTVSPDLERPFHRLRSSS